MKKIISWKIHKELGCCDRLAEAQTIVLGKPDDNKVMSVGEYLDAMMELHRKWQKNSEQEVREAIFSLERVIGYDEAIHKHLNNVECNKLSRCHDMQSSSNCIDCSNLKNSKFCKNCHNSVNMICCTNINDFNDGFMICNTEVTGDKFARFLSHMAMPENLFKYCLDNNFTDFGIADQLLTLEDK